MKDLYVVLGRERILGPLPVEEAYSTLRFAEEPRGIVVDRDLIVYAIKGPAEEDMPTISQLDARNELIRGRLEVEALCRAG